jgi:ketosteroid isomerase-like protein
MEETMSKPADDGAHGRWTRGLEGGRLARDHARFFPLIRPPHAEVQEQRMKNSLLVLLGSMAVVSFLFCRPSFSEEPGSDLAAADAAVRKADAEWAAAASTAGVEAWMAHYGADVIVLLPNEQLANGKELVRRSAARFLATSHLSVAWHPTKVEMARSGELAYLAGVYELRFADARGASKSDRGRHNEIWRKQTDGSWKCIVDTWSSDESTGAPSNPVSSQPATPVNAVRAPATTEHRPDSKYGAIPSGHEESIRQYFQEHLKDPDSVQYQEITKPEQGYTKAITGTVLMSETRNYGWTVKATINAKNSGGSYVGFKTYTFLFRGEKIAHVLVPLTGDEIN